ncbi:hypothetical protein HG536_0D06020 [Torulaspora globosa]|uniref:Uncharacterized protein n=1 Tax=Torulaspora globosa TaxID=48254 RepID=A0A7G3ZHU4_9SACH|nr:uncharacterized protein HG536_0D06020 [Torulaspora globosa]QLL33080.1 hypothetical protein HG536_0D06020 [Torulaspora globosa]
MGHVTPLIVLLRIRSSLSGAIQRSIRALDRSARRLVVLPFILTFNLFNTPRTAVPQSGTNSSKVSNGGWVQLASTATTTGGAVGECFSRFRELYVHFPRSLLPTVSILQQLAKSLSKLLTKPPKITAQSIEKELPEMRQTVAKLAQAYVPMIKFVGGRHPQIQHSGAVKCHPCTVDGLLPGSDGCVPAGEFLSKQKPFQVFPYRSNGSGQFGSGSSSAGSASAELAEKNRSRYAFVDRPLKDKELDSIFELPARFRYKPISDLEAEAINGGGAL